MSKNTLSVVLHIAYFAVVRLSDKIDQAKIVEKQKRKTENGRFIMANITLGQHIGSKLPVKDNYSVKSCVMLIWFEIKLPYKMLRFRLFTNE